MARKARPGRPPAKDKSARVSVSLPRGVYETLGHIAQEKKVSLAWVIREATEQYVANQWPLLGKP